MCVPLNYRSFLRLERRARIPLGAEQPPTAGRRRAKINTIFVKLVILSVLCVVGFIGNILVCVAIRTDRRLHNVTNYFLFSLALADLFVCCFVMPFSSLVEVRLGVWTWSFSWCLLYAYADVFLCSASIVHMSVISLDRYLGISRPLRATRSRTRSVVAAKIAFVWLVTTVISSPLAALALLDHENILRSNVCAINNRYYMIYGSTLSFLIPFAVMAVTYVRTTRLLNRQAAQLSVGGIVAGSGGNAACICRANGKTDGGGTRLGSAIGCKCAACGASDRFHNGLRRTVMPRRKMGYVRSDSLARLNSGGMIYNVVLPSQTPPHHKSSVTSRASTTAAANSPKAVVTVRRQINASGTSTASPLVSMTVSNGADFPFTSPPNSAANVFVWRRRDGNNTGMKDNGIFMRNGDVVGGGSLMLMDTTAASVTQQNGEDVAERNSGAILLVSPTFGGGRRWRRVVDELVRRVNAIVFGVVAEKVIRNAAAESAFDGSTGGEATLMEQRSPTILDSRSENDAAPSNVVMRLTRNTAAALSMRHGGGRGRRRRRSRRGNSTSASSELATEHKATRVLAVVFTCFFVCWTPFFLSNFAYGFCGEPCALPTWAGSLFLWLGYTSSTLNPIIYTIFNHRFRDAFVRILRCSCIFEGAAMKEFRDRCLNRRSTAQRYSSGANSGCRTGGEFQGDAYYYRQLIGNNVINRRTFNNSGGAGSGIQDEYYYRERKSRNYRDPTRAKQSINAPRQLRQKTSATAKNDAAKAIALTSNAPQFLSQTTAGGSLRLKTRQRRRSVAFADDGVPHVQPPSQPRKFSMMMLPVSCRTAIIGDGSELSMRSGGVFSDMSGGATTNSHSEDGNSDLTAMSDAFSSEALDDSVFTLSATAPHATFHHQQRPSYSSRHCRSSRRKRVSCFDFGSDASLILSSTNHSVPKFSFRPPSSSFGGNDTYDGWDDDDIIGDTVPEDKKGRFSNGRHSSAMPLANIRQMLRLTVVDNERSPLGRRASAAFAFGNGASPLNENYSETEPLTLAPQTTLPPSGPFKNVFLQEAFRGSCSVMKTEASMLFTSPLKQQSTSFLTSFDHRNADIPLSSMTSILHQQNTIMQTPNSTQQHHLSQQLQILRPSQSSLRSTELIRRPAVVANQYGNGGTLTCFRTDGGSRSNDNVIGSNDQFKTLSVHAVIDNQPALDKDQPSVLYGVSQSVKIGRRFVRNETAI